MPQMKLFKKIIEIFKDRNIKNMKQKYLNKKRILMAGVIGLDQESVSRKLIMLLRSKRNWQKYNK
jgi:hypothetical protein